jgi:predicted amidophosphoribosyltransferase
VTKFAGTCGICGEPCQRVTEMCDACGRSYDRTAHRDGSIIEALLWAARRARRFERKRLATEKRSDTR